MASAKPDFYSVVGQTELDVYQSILSGTLAADLGKLVAAFSEHHARVKAPKMWRSVHDNARFIFSSVARGSTAGSALLSTPQQFARDAGAASVLV